MARCAKCGRELGEDGAAGGFVVDGQEGELCDRCAPGAFDSMVRRVRAVLDEPVRPVRQAAILGAVAAAVDDMMRNRK